MSSTGKARLPIAASFKEVTARRGAGFFKTNSEQILTAKTSSWNDILDCGSFTGENLSRESIITTACVLPRSSIAFSDRSRTFSGEEAFA